MTIWVEMLAIIPDDKIVNPDRAMGPLRVFGTWSHAILIMLVSLYYNAYLLGIIMLVS